MRTQSFLGGTAVREGVIVWAATLAGLAVLELVSRGVPYLGQLVGAIAVAAFLWIPQKMLERRGLDARDAGLTLARWREDLLNALVLAAIILPIFTLGYLKLGALLPMFPRWLASLAAPFSAPDHFAFRLPPSSVQWAILGQLGGHAAVALSEEFFYRGYLTLLFETAWPPRAQIAGAKLGQGALLAAVLFAVGHLLVPAPFRLLTFFPALLFAWLRARTHTIAGAALFHFLCNAVLVILQNAIVSG